MNKIKYSILFALFLSANIYAACYQVDQSGRKWITSNGATNTTALTIKQCTNVNFAIPIQNQLCIASTSLLFDKTWAGVKLDLNPAPDGKAPCYYLKVKPIGTGIQLQMYDASRVAADGTESCNP